MKNNDTGQKSGGRGRVFGEASEDFNMPLIYAFVARGTTVLAEHTGHSGNFATVAAEVRRVNSALLPPFCDVYAQRGLFLLPPGGERAHVGARDRPDRGSFVPRRLYPRRITRDRDERRSKRPADP